MAKPVLLISDLHLEPARQDITDAFFSFLENHRGNCAALYILGDLFEVWIGDDAPSTLADEVAARLKAFSDCGIPVYLMHGNRDFLIGAEFANRCGATLVNDPYELQVGDASYLLLHGDTLCTDDVEYQEFRNQVRNNAWQQGFLAKSVEERDAFARAAREKSAEATANKRTEIMDVNPDAVLELITRSGHTQIIHGHTHRPAQHEVALPQPVNGYHSASRTVLGDWDKAGWCGEVTADGVELHKFPLGETS